MKPHKGLKNSIKKTATGKGRYKSRNAGHLMSGKSGNRCRSLRKPCMLTGAISKNIKTKLGAA